MDKIPQHIAIILDGNGRYAKALGKNRSFGHVEGAKRIEPLCRSCNKFGVKYLTLYAFSTENWKRPKDEVTKLMELFHSYLDNFFKPVLENNMRFRVIGYREGLSKNLQKEIAKLEEESKNNTGLNLQVAINYGSRDEMIRAFNKWLKANPGKKELTGEEFENFLDTAGIPDPDLIIRTGGEQRLSNYLLWQAAYAELYFTETLWPLFDEAELKKAIDEYAGRDRRFGNAK